jgi:hypothetical protein
MPKVNLCSWHNHPKEKDGKTLGGERRAKHSIGNGTMLLLMKK